MADHVDGAHDAGRLEALAPLEQQHQLLEQVPHLVGLVAGDGDLVAPHVDLDAAERGLDHAQQLVAVAEEVGHEVVAGDGDLDLGGRHEGTRLGTSRAAAFGAGRVEVRRSVAYAGARASRSRRPRRPRRTAGGRPASNGGRPRPGSTPRPRPGPASTGCAGRPRRRAPLAGVLADLADGRVPVRLHLRAGGPFAGTVRAVGVDLVAVAADGSRGSVAVVALAAVCSVRTGPGRAAGHRRPDRDVLAAPGGRPRGAGGRARAGARGHSRRRDRGRRGAVGRAGRRDAAHRSGRAAAAYVPLAAVAAVVVGAADVRPLDAATRRRESGRTRSLPSRR